MGKLLRCSCGRRCVQCILLGVGGEKCCVGPLRPQLPSRPSWRVTSFTWSPSLLISPADGSTSRRGVFTSLLSPCFHICSHWLHRAKRVVLRPAPCREAVCLMCVLSSYACGSGSRACGHDGRWIFTLHVSVPFPHSSLFTVAA